MKIRFPFSLTLWLLVGGSWLALALQGKAQCCAPGNPLGGTSNAGTVSASTLRASFFYRHSYADTYYDVDQKAAVQGTTAAFNFIGSTLAYGLTSRLTVETELGYYLNKTKKSPVAPTEKAGGIANATLSLKYGIWKDKVRDWEITAGAGFRFPFSRKLIQSEFGYPYSMDIQPSTGATGFMGQLFLYKGYVPAGWRFFLVNRFETYRKNDIGYRYGQANYTSLFVSRKIDRHWTAILQLRNEWRDYDYWDNIRLVDSGGEVLYAAPQLNYHYKQTWNLSLLFETPVLRHYHYTQLGSKYALSLILMREFKI